VQCWKKALPKWELIYRGQFVGRLCLIHVYLTSLHYYFSRPLSLVWWFCWQWARVAFSSCVHTLRCALVKVSCFSMYYWVTLSKLMGQKTFKNSERTTYPLQRRTWDIQGHMRNDCSLPYLVADLINYCVELYQENCLTLETILHFCLVLLQCPCHKK